MFDISLLFSNFLLLVQNQSQESKKNVDRSHAFSKWVSLGCIWFPAARWGWVKVSWQTLPCRPKSLIPLWLAVAFLWSSLFHLGYKYLAIKIWFYQLHNFVFADVLFWLSQLLLNCLYLLHSNFSLSFSNSSLNFLDWRGKNSCCCGNRGPRGQIAHATFHLFASQLKHICAGTNVIATFFKVF